MEIFKILFLDDEEPILRTLKRILRKHKEFEIFTTTDIQEAFDLIEKENPDVVVSDLAMPEMSGIDFLKKIKSIKPNLISILLTGQATLEAAQEAINTIGIFTLILKPWDNQQLYDHLSRACQVAKKKKIESDLIKTSVSGAEEIMIDLDKIHIFLAEWDEDFGPKPIIIYPKIPQVSEEEFVNQTFMAFSSVYGQEWEGEGTTLNLPIDYLKMHSRIYFNYKSADEVRGGRLPFMLGILMIKMPKILEENLDNIIIPKMDNLDTLRDELDKEKIKDVVKELQDTIKHRLEEILNI